MKSLLKILVFALLIFALPVLAGLGKSEAECAKIFGKPIVRDEFDNGYVRTTHKYRKMLVRITYFKGKSAKISYGKQGYFSTTEIRKFLKEYSNGKKWKKNNIWLQRWDRKGACAIYKSRGNYDSEFCIMDEDKMTDFDESRKISKKY